MKVLVFLVNHLYLTFFTLGIGVVFWLKSRRDQHAQQAKKLIEKALQTNTAEPMTLHPEIDPAKCGGCGACTKVCPEGDILKLIQNKAVLVSPTKCVGHGECEQVCPFEAISLVFGTKTRGMDIPRVSGHYETNVPGLYIAGELGGMGLIRNAIKQGILAATHALEGSGQLKPVDSTYDLLIVGAGPAGLAAGLTAIAQKKKYLLIEQDRFGGTVSNFPRQKVVMSHPFELPIVGKMKFTSNKVSKEQLLQYWTEVRQSTGLKVQEQTQFQSLEKNDGVFLVKTNQGEIKARKIILALGVRGSPRKLNVPGENLSKVTYNLIDPEQYQQKSVVVVGGGNAGLETAQMLADAKYKNKVHLLVRGPSFDRANQDNINRVTELQKQGRVEICFETTVLEISESQISLQKGSQKVQLPNDYVFVCAGAELPFKFLMSLGVAIDKKFGAKKAS